MSLLRPALRPALNPITKTLLSVSRRLFTQFDSVAQSYVNSGGIVSTAGNVLEMEVDFSTINSVSLSNLIGLYTNLTAEGFGLRIEQSGANGFIKFYSAGYTPGLGTTNVFDGKLHKVSARINKASGAFTVFLDGLEEYTGTHSDVTKIVDAYHVSVGARVTEVGGSVESYTDGIIANAKVYSDSTTVLDMPIDRNYTPTNNTVIDRASGNNGTFVNVADGDSEAYTLEGGDWVAVDIAPSGFFEKTTDDPLEITLTSSMEVGKPYLVEFIYTNNDSTPSARLGSSVAGEEGEKLKRNVTDEKYSDVITSSSSSGLFISGPASRCSIRNVSVKQIVEVEY